MPWRLLKRLPGVKSSRRKLVCLLLGLTWLGYGFGVLTDPYPEARFGHVITFLSAFLDSPATGLVWMLCAAIAIATGLSLLPETVGFRFLVIPPTMWCALYFWSWVTWCFVQDEGNSRGWVAAAAWGALCLLTAVIAGWPDVVEEKQ